MLGSADLIADLAAAREAHVLQRHGGDLLVAVSLRRPDGRIIRYALAVDARTTEPNVREKAPENLPAFCPDRHINGDGSFCMNWQSADPIYVTDETSAREWWSRLLKYLRLQEAAKQLRRWPSKGAWAHGAAADAQRRAEVCSIALGPAFQDALAARLLQLHAVPDNPILCDLRTTAAASTRCGSTPSASQPSGSAACAVQAARCAAAPTMRTGPPSL